MIKLVLVCCWLVYVFVFFCWCTYLFDSCISCFIADSFLFFVLKFVIIVILIVMIMVVIINPPTFFGVWKQTSPSPPSGRVLGEGGEGVKRSF